MRVKFHKMHGLGNDFIIIDARDNEGKLLDTIDQKKLTFLADRKIGVGCDQIIIIDYPYDLKDYDIEMKI